ncbi:MAG: D-alanyl-D-alanine carboxypeptidase [Rhodobacteraceae bacterium]|nr:D-alanyl-D-alanine carboxypeptidase [Paracoccaceae bacterium]
MLAFVAAGWLVPSAVRAFETTARAAFVLDHTTGTPLLAKNPDLPLPPASMSKLMTLYLAFEAVRDGRLNLEERLPVSQHAMSYKGSTMFLNTTDRVKVIDLLRGIIVLSGNDACVVIAEALSPDGTEAGFARAMNQRARDIGLRNSTFKNSNGWPAQGQTMSMRDLVILAQHLIADFPEFYPMFAETEYTYGTRAPKNNRNRNPLLTLGIGADGLKTGYTEASGYGLVGSAVRDGRRVIFALAGLGSTRERAEVSEALLNWSFRQFRQVALLEAGERVSVASVWMGAQNSVGLVVAEPLEVVLPVDADQDVAAEVVYEGPLQAPIIQGQELATLLVRPAGLPPLPVPLVAESDVAFGGLWVRVKTAVQVLAHRVGLVGEGTP